MSKLGIPYMGSKRRLSEQIMNYICAQNPNATHFYDLFGGGGAVSFEALQRPQFKQVHYNELNIGVVALLKKIQCDGVTGDFYQWISRDTFERHKGDNDWFGGLCKTVWSFGNNQKGYLFGREVGEYKKWYHEVVVSNIDNTDKMADYCHDYVKNKYGISEPLTLKMPTSIDYQERRFEIRSQLVSYEKRCKLSQFGEIQIKRLQQLQLLQQLEQLERLQQLQQLEQLQQLQISNKSYSDVLIDSCIDKTVVYCDPPYEGTAKYAEKGFNHRDFDLWVKASDYKIYVSGYKSDLPCVYEMRHSSSLNANKTNKTTERLFCNKQENNTFRLI